MALLAAALVMASVATTLVAAVPLYSDAIVEAGLRSTLLDADPADGGFEAAFRTDAAGWTAMDRSLQRLTDDRLPGPRREVLRARSDTYQLPAAAAEAGWITPLGVVRGDVFVDVGPVRPVTPGALGARLHTAAAELLGLEAGDRTPLGRTG